MELKQGSYPCTCDILCTASVELQPNAASSLASCPGTWTVQTSKELERRVVTFGSSRSLEK